MDKKNKDESIEMSDGFLLPNENITYHNDTYTYVGKTLSKSSGELCGIFTNGEVECLIPSRVIKTMKDRKLVY